MKIEAEKKRLREIMLQKRLAQSAPEKAANDAAWLARAGEFLKSQTEAKVIAGYHTMRGELDVLPLLQQWQASPDHLSVLPRMLPQAATPLTFHHYSEAKLEAGRFGTTQPQADCPQAMPHIIFVPLLAVDSMGHRLGYGGGYYDATLITFAAFRPLTIGCAYDFQFSDDPLPHQRHDTRLDMVITPSRVIYCE